MKRETTIAIIGLFIFSFSFLWGLFETFVFLIEYGWHYRAINKAEQICDFIAATGTTIGITLFIIGYNLTIKNSIDSE